MTAVVMDHFCGPGSAIGPVRVSVSELQYMTFNLDIWYMLVRRCFGYVGIDSVSISTDRSTCSVLPSGAGHSSHTLRRTAKSYWHIQRYGNCCQTRNI